MVKWYLKQKIGSVILENELISMCNGEFSDCQVHLAE